MSLRNLILSASGLSGSVVYPVPSLSDMVLRTALRTNATWVNSTSINCIENNDSIFIIGGAQGKIATSTDGVTWQVTNNLKDSSFGAANVTAIHWTGAHFIAAGSLGRVATSPDGINWTFRGTLASTAWGPNHSVFSMASNGSRVVVVGENGKVAYSDDGGATWVFRLIMGVSVFRAVVWTGSFFVAGGEASVIYTSPDGHTWTSRPGLSNTEWRGTTLVTSLCSTPYGLIAGGNYGRIARSLDHGVTWQHIPALSQTTFDSNAVSKLIVLGDEVIAFGGTGRVGKSPNGTSWLYSDILRTKGWNTNLGINTAHVGKGKLLVGGTSAEFMTT